MNKKCPNCNCNLTEFHPIVKGTLHSCFYYKDTIVFAFKNGMSFGCKANTLTCASSKRLAEIMETNFNRIGIYWGLNEDSNIEVMVRKFNKKKKPTKNLTNANKI